MFRTPDALRAESAIMERAMKALSDFGMMDERNETAMSLPHGKQKALGILMALSTDPKLLLLDEPTAGMSGAETGEIMRLISRIKGAGVTVMLVEHDLRVVMGVCNRVIVLNFGCKIAEGSPEEIAQNESVISAYLGFDHSKESMNE